MQNKVRRGGGGPGVKWGGQGGSELRIEVIVKMQKSVGVLSVVGWGQSGCERRIEVIVKMIKKSQIGGCCDKFRSSFCAENIFPAFQ